MQLDWTKNLTTDEAKTEFEQYLKGSKRLLNRMEEILNGYEKSLDRSETSLEVYDKPNWGERQAHKNGYRACLYRIKDLINLDLKEQLSGQPTRPARPAGNRSQ